MYRSWSFVAVATLALAVSVGCNKAAATVDTSSEGKQFRAVCSEKTAHGGNEQVLSRWLDERDKALALGEYHSNFKDKGHRVRIEERLKPPAAPASN